MPLPPTSSRPFARATLVLVLAALAVSSAAAQDSQPAAELPADLRAVLNQVEDFSFSFTHPGFYAVVEHVQSSGTSPGHARPPLDVPDWTALLERPAEFRGLPVTIEGVVGRNTAWQLESDRYRHLGTLWQLELWRQDQPVAATVILTNDATDIPIGATIRVTGYFVMMRQYYSSTNRLRQAALVVADGPTVVSQATTRAPSRSPAHWIVGLVITATAALLVLWIILRRSVATTRRTTAPLRAQHAAPISLADDLADWATKEPDQLLDDESQSENDTAR